MNESFHADPRLPDEIIEGIRRNAEDSSTPGDPSWVAEILEQPFEPSASVLRALCVTLHTSISRFNTLPDRFRRAYFIERLETKRREPRGERVYARLQGVSARLPLSIAGGIDFHTAKMEKEAPRIFRLEQASTITGTTLGAINSYQRLDDGRDLAISQNLEDGQLVDTVFPFGRAEQASEHGVSRSLYLSSPLLPAGQKDTTLRVTFHDVGPTPEIFENALRLLEWSCTSKTGFSNITPKRVVIHGKSVTAEIQFESDLEAVENDTGKPVLDLNTRVELGLEPVLRLRKPLAADSPRDLGPVTFMNFESVELVFEGKNHPISAALVNGHPVDLNAPFAPMGDPAQVGTSLHLAAKAVFGLPLESLQVSMIAVDGSWQTNRATSLQPDSAIDRNPCVSWRRARAGLWTPVVGVSRLRPLPLPRRDDGNLRALGGLIQFHFRKTGRSFTEMAKIGSQAGFWLQASLERGDFGWSRFLKRQESFVEEMANRESPSLIKRFFAWIPGMPKATLPILPPQRPKTNLIGRVEISYCSEPIGPDVGQQLVQMWSSVADTILKKTIPTNSQGTQSADGVARFFPFQFGPSRWRGELYVGFRGLHPDTSMSVLLDIRMISARGAQHNGSVAFEYWSPEKGKWCSLAVLDGTNGLREAGVLRWHSPADWTRLNVLEPFTLRNPEPLSWMRIRVTQPSEALCLRLVTCDAVNLHEVIRPASRNGFEYETPALPPLCRMTPARAVPGLMAAITLEESSEGVPPEAPEQLVVRAGQRTRHRMRGLSAEDLEDLILAEFPEIAQVHCRHLRNTPLGNDPCLKVFVVPAGNAQFPVVTQRLRLAISGWIQPMVVPGLNVSVEDAGFRMASVRTCVEARPNEDPEVLRRRILTLLNLFLQPRDSRTGNSQLGRALGLQELEKRLLAEPGVLRVRTLAFAAPHGEMSAIRPSPWEIITTGNEHIVQVVA